MAGLRTVEDTSTIFKESLKKLENKKKESFKLITQLDGIGVNVMINQVSLNGTTKMLQLAFI